MSEPVANVIKEHLEGSKLDRISLYGCQNLNSPLFYQVMQAFEKCSLLTVFDLTCCQIGDQAFNYLTEWVGQCGHLEKLKVADNQITDVGVLSLCTNVLENPHCLTEVDLEHNAITTKGVDQIIKVLKQKRSQKLKFFFLTYNSIDEKGTKALRDISNL